MIRNNENGSKSLKEIKEQQRIAEEAKLKEQCEALAFDRYGKEKVIGWSNQHKGLFYLPITDNEGAIEKLGIMRPIDRHILSYASTKMTDDGLYGFLEVCMREIWIEGDVEILDVDEYFIPAAMQFNKILEGKKASLVKR